MPGAHFLSPALSVAACVTRKTGHWCIALWPRGKCWATRLDGFMRRIYFTERFPVRFYLTPGSFEAAWTCTATDHTRRDVKTHGNLHCSKGLKQPLTYRTTRTTLRKIHWDVANTALLLRPTMHFCRKLCAHGVGSVMQAVPFARRGKDTCLSS